MKHCLKHLILTLAQRRQNARVGDLGKLPCHTAALNSLTETQGNILQKSWQGRLKPQRSLTIPVTGKTATHTIHLLLIKEDLGGEKQRQTQKYLPSTSFSQALSQSFMPSSSRASRASPLRGCALSRVTAAASCAFPSSSTDPCVLQSFRIILL